VKDLYKRLNIDSSATPEEIQCALEAISDPGIRERVEKILLRPDRRKVYDRNHRVLMQITEMRHRLSLYDKECWASGSYGDFTSVADPENVVNIPRRRFKRRGWKPVWTLGVVLFCVILLELDSLSRFGRLGSDYLRSIKPHISLPWGRSKQPNHRFVFHSMAARERSVPIDIRLPFLPEFYVVQLKDWESGELVLKVFLNSVGTYKGEVSPGAYRLQYAAGADWVSEEKLFGESTVYSEAIGKLNIVGENNSGSRVVIELRRQDPSEREVTRIDAEDFR
jgi:hypothetical protein